MASMRRAWIHILLFVLTVASTCFAGGLISSSSGSPSFSFTAGLSYSIPLMVILLGHEFGHYFMSRKYGVRSTLPFFLPFPLPPFGTLGAIIRMESIVTSRRALFDIGVAGPIASFCLSIPAIAIGLKLSEVILASQFKGGDILAEPFLFSLIQRLVSGQVEEGYSVILHPVGFAGWVGLFVTALNLLPVGQLDGGHVVYAVFGKRSRSLFFMTLAVMIFITVFYNPGWLLLLILIILFGFRHPAPLDDETPLDGRRKLIGGIVFAIFVLSFTPAPFPELVDEFKQFIPWL